MEADPPSVGRQERAHRARRLFKPPHRARREVVQEQPRRSVDTAFVHDVAVVRRRDVVAYLPVPRGRANGKPHRVAGLRLDRWRIAKRYEGPPQRDTDDQAQTQPGHYTAAPAGGLCDCSVFNAVGVSRLHLLQGDAGLADVAEAAHRIALEAASDEDFDPGRCLLREVGEIDLRAEHGGQRMGDRLAVEQPLAGQQLVQHDAEGPDVAAAVGRLAGGLLGTHVGGGAENHAGLRPGGGHRRGKRWIARGGRCGIGSLGQAEVKDLGFTVRSQLDVGGFEVAVDHPVFVGGFDAGGDFAGGAQGLLHGKRSTE